MKFKFFILIVFLGFVLTAQAKVAEHGKSRGFKNKTKKENIIRSEIGLNIPQWGIAIDAVFDPRLDDIIPDYHIVNLVLTNRRGEAIVFDVMRDKWVITDNAGKKHIAHNHVRHFNKKLWSELPEKLKNMIDYPNKVNPGKSITIDVFLPKSVDLFNFREVLWKSAFLNKEFNIFTSYENSLSIQEKGGKEFDLPKLAPKYDNSDGSTTTDESATPTASSQTEFDPALDKTLTP